MNTTQSTHKKTKTKNNENISTHLFFQTLLILVAILVSQFSLLCAEGNPPFGDHIVLRGNLNNSRLQFEQKKTGNVAFLGGSITEAAGYRPMVYDILKKRFPNTTFTFTNAGIGSTCSNTGAFRLERDVLQQGPVDLLFVEFAVNDDQDGHFNRTEAIRGMEGVIRHARMQNPNLDIVMTFMVNEHIISMLQKGEMPISIAAHDEVAKHYQIPTISVAKEMTAQIAAGTMTYAQYGGVHPGPVGQALIARMMDELFSRFWSAPLPATAQQVAQVMPAEPLDALSYFRGRFMDVKLATIKNGWKIESPDWKNFTGNVAPRFKALPIPMLCANEPGAEAAVEFDGTALGAFILAGPDAGIVEVSVDGGPSRPINLFGPYSGGWQYPWTVMLATDLKPGKHQVTLRISDKTSRTGHAMRIMQFCVN
ncbi:MAG: GDSL-type esterase/lipase family protein [bacterium]